MPFTSPVFFDSIILQTTDFLHYRYLYYKDTNERVLNNGNPVRQGTGIGNGGTAQGLGIGGMMLQDGSCYTVQ